MSDRIMISQAPWTADLEIRYGIESDREWSVAMPATFSPEARGRVVEPVMRISRDAGQQLLNQLWHLGIRPQDNTGSTGHLRALENHIQSLEETNKRLFLELGGRKCGRDNF